METIRHSPINSKYSEVIVSSRIVYLSKDNEGTTQIHLDTGEVLLSEDSMNTIEARIKIP